MHIQHTHPIGTTSEAREETLRLLYQNCLRELQRQGVAGSCQWHTTLAHNSVH